MILDLAVVTGVITVASFFIAILGPLMKLHSRIDLLTYRQDELSHDIKELREEIRKSRLQ